MAEELFPSDLVVWDSRPESNSYQGRKHDMFTSLERENAGSNNALDIRFTLASRWNQPVASPSLTLGQWWIARYFGRRDFGLV